MSHKELSLKEMLENYKRLVIFYGEEEPNENLVEYFEGRVIEYGEKLEKAKQEEIEKMKQEKYKAEIDKIFY